VNACRFGVCVFMCVVSASFKKGCVKNRHIAKK
jgi:hypothetical protein